jgi:hypothetical protein
MEWLGQIIIGSGVEPGFFIGKIAASCKHEHRRFPTPQSVVFQNFHSSRIGQLPIEHYQVVIVLLETTCSFCPVDDHLYGVAFEDQKVLDRCPGVGVILDY